MTGEILFLAHRIPFPPDRGDKIRSHNVLKALTRIAPVHVAAFYDDIEDRKFEADLEAVSQSHCLVARRKPLAIAGLQAVLSGRPVSLTAFRDRRLAAYVRHILKTRDIAAIYVFSGQMAQYVPRSYHGRVVADLVDVDSAKFDAYATRSTGLRALLERREGRLMAGEEARIVGMAAATLLVSPPEADLLRARIGSGCPHIRAMGNGIDAEHFSPSAVHPADKMRADGFPRLIFTGQMDYVPNIDAAFRAVTRILPIVRQKYPTATLHIVGRNPPPSLTDLSGHSGVTVWGRVDDIRPWLAAADIALVPLEIARGVQNKVLEAMAMGVPTVLSPGAATGIGAEDGAEFLVRNTDTEMAQAIMALIQDAAYSAHIGRAARSWIVENASWEAALANLPQYLGMPSSVLTNAA